MTPEVLDVSQLVEEGGIRILSKKNAPKIETGKIESKKSFPRFFQEGVKTKVYQWIVETIKQKAIPEAGITSKQFSQMEIKEAIINEMANCSPVPDQADFHIIKINDQTFRIIVSFVLDSVTIKRFVVPVDIALDGSCLVRPLELMSESE